MNMIEVRAVGNQGLEGLSTHTVSVPQPKADEILVRMTAATLNYRDILILYGILPKLNKEPHYVPLSCGCGEVTAIGENVTRVSVGDRVTPLYDQGWISGSSQNMSGLHLGGSCDGVAREYAVFNEQHVAIIPGSLSDFGAATLPCAGITAWNSLFLQRPIKPGDLVLLQGTGGVSIAALQFAKAAGAEVIITSSSDKKLARAKALGADHGINYKHTPDWAAAALEISKGRGVDLIVDVVGGTQVEMAASAAASGALISAVGMLDGEFSWGRELSVPVAMIRTGNRDQFEAMLRAISVNKIQPVVDAVFPLTQLNDAIKLMQSGQFFGKIGISFN